MGSRFAGLTTRGRSFVAAGAAVFGIGFGLGQNALLSLGALLILLPLLSSLAVGRARYRVRSARTVAPGRAQAGQRARVTVAVDNVSRFPTGLLLAEDTVPYSLGARPRFVLERIQPGGRRELSYELQLSERGKFVIGPLLVRVADTFGLVEFTRSFAEQSTLLVTPPVTALPRMALAGSWLGEGGAKASTAAAAGEDDVVPRAYRDGDELRRVHWRSTARHGALMVRREEQRWRNRAVLLLDARASAHAGARAGSSFEFAVGAAASIGVHLAREGIDGQFLTDSGAAPAPGRFEDVLLDALAVIRPSRSPDLTRGLAATPSGLGGLLIAVCGRLSPAHARQLASARKGDSPALAVLLAVSTWAADRPGAELADETRPAATVLAGAGWRVITVGAHSSLADAWGELNRPAAPPGGAPRRPAETPR